MGKTKDISILAITLGVAGILAIAASSTQAVQFADGTVAFDNSPRLINAVATLIGVRVWGAKYYFTLKLPENAGEPLQKLTISQRKGEDDIRFRVEETFAFKGTHRNKGERLTLQTVSRDEETGTISVIFDPPILPGTTFSVRLQPRRNPSSGGLYLFGITAFPAGEKSNGLYLGVGRLHFHEEFDLFPGR